MTHLVIENQNSNTEIVSAAIILKLYEMALSAEGDVSLEGNLLSDHAKLTAYDYLTGNLTGTSTKRFPNLSLNITGGLYVDFADPEVERVLLANNIGDGVGITLNDASNVGLTLGGYFLSMFKENDVITSFNELSNFSYTVIAEACFLKCYSLLQIDLTNITNIKLYGLCLCTALTNVGSLLNLRLIGPYSFAYTLNLVMDIDLNLTSLGAGAFYKSGITKLKISGPISSIPAADSAAESRAFGSCTNLTEVDLSESSILTIGLATFPGCSNLLKIILPSTLTSIGGWAFQSSSENVRTYILYSTNPPTLSAKHSILDTNAGIPKAIYVPDNSVSAYLSALYWSSWSQYIKPMSEYTAQQSQ